MEVLPYVRNSQGAQDLPRIQVPETKGVSMANSETGLQDTDRLDKVRCENQLLLPVNAQSVRRELLTQNVEGALHILRPLVDDVKVGIGLNETARRGSHGRAHVSDEESSIGLSTDLICNRGEDSAVTLEELRTVGVRCVKVEPCVLDFC